MSSIAGLQEEADEHYDDIPMALPLAYNNGDSIGSAKDTTSEFERGGGMRLNVDELLDQRKAKIEELKARLGTALPQSQEFDDIFLLRFVLTWEKKGGMGEAEKAIRSTIAWRTENAKTLAETRRTGVAPHEAKFLKFQTTGYSGDLAGLEPLYIVRTGLCNVKGLMNSMPYDEVADFLLLSKEVAYARCDALTRKTRQLIKMITVVDMAGYSMFGGDSRFYKALGESSKKSAEYYPQLLGKTVLINTPSFMRVVWSAFAVFMPKSALEKTAICPATGTALASTPDASTCPFIKRWCSSSTASIPDFLGGTMQCPDALKPRSECSNALIKVTVNARSSQTIEVFALLVLSTCVTRTKVLAVLVPTYFLY
jgi:hypothetical protein